MELNSVTQIREAKNSLKERIADIDKNQFKDSLYGSESEYTYRGLLGGLDCLLTDITTLTKAPSQFVKLSTYQERQQILNAIKNCDAYLSSPQNLITHLDNLKIAIRPFHIRYTQERLIEFDEELSNVVKKKQALEEELAKTLNLKEENEELAEKLVEKNGELESLLDNVKEKLSDTNLKNQDLISKLSTLETKIEEGENLIEQAEEIVTSTNSYLTEAKKSTETITEFENTVDKREKQVKTIDSRTLEYRQKIEEFEAEREALNKKAQETINDALTALEYNTARGLSASFQSQLEKIEKSHYGRWLWGAAIFMLVTIGIGVWIVVSGHNVPTATIGRIVLTTFTITGAVFCANQYIRTKNVIEDYSYKMVLAKSIVGFSEQLNNGHDNTDEYKAYIQMALSEIHQDPLRKRSKNDKDIDGGVKTGIDMVIETAQKIVGLTKNS
jgi:hypothetical protein